MVFLSLRVQSLNRWFFLLLAASVSAFALAQNPAYESFPDRKPGSGSLFLRVLPSASGLERIHSYPTNASLVLMQEHGAGAGICVGDVTGDGLPEIAISYYNEGCRLYRNRGEFLFEDMTESAGIRCLGRWCTGMSFVDMDNDGDLDLYVCCLNAPNLMFVNHGHGTFVERAEALGLAWVGASIMGAFADYDRDGRIDLYLLTHRDALHRDQALPRSSAEAGSRGIVNRGADGKGEVASAFRELFELIERGEGRVELAIAGQGDVLFHQRSDGTFTNATAQAGIRGNDIGLGVSWWDFDGDGWLDLYVANDHKTPDRLWRNQGDGTFKDQARTSLPHVPHSSMGTDVADVNNDGWMDLLATDMAGSSHARRLLLDNSSEKNAWFLTRSNPRQFPRNAFFLGTGTPMVLEAAFTAGVSATDWTWSPKFGDFDGDGWVDLFVANGMARDYLNGDLLTRMKQRGNPGWRHEAILKERNLAFRNDGNLSFDPIASEWGLNHLSASFGASLGDLDRDGDLDLVVMNLGETVSLYRNQEYRNHRVTLGLKGSRSNRWGIGAHITAETAQGLQSRTVSLASGFMSANEPIVHFGLGEKTIVPRLHVRWPSGIHQTFENLPADRHYTLVEPATEPSAVDVATKARPWFSSSNRLLAFAHLEHSFEDTLREPLIPWKVSQMGPGLALADIDGDGDEDFFLGGSAGEPGVLGIHGPDHQFTAHRPAAFQADAPSEDLGSLFFDADGDGDLDLYVVSGGVETKPGDARLQDRLYWNNGKGDFRRAPDGALPREHDAGSVVVAADLDRDGDLDLFVGGRSVPGQYPLPARSFLLRNDGGTFVEATSTLADGLTTLGVVTGAIWSDVNKDGWVDLIISQEWGTMRCFLNRQGKLKDATPEVGFGVRPGLWQGVAATDVDCDGDVDFITSNFGTNSRYRAARGKALHLYRGDFFDLGVTNLLEAGYSGDRLVALRGREPLLNAFPPLAEAHPTFASLSVATLTDLFPVSALNRAYSVAIETLETGLWINSGGHFDFRPLPVEAQLAPTFGTSAIDANGDGYPDLVLSQNFYPLNLEMQRMDGSLGLLLVGSKQGTFQAVGPAESGLMQRVDARALGFTDLNGDGFPDIVLAPNDGGMIALESTLMDRPSMPAQMRVRLEGRKGNPTGVGARVEVRGADGWFRVSEVYAGSGYLSQSTTQLNFPIPPTPGIIELTVRWATGESTSRRLDRQALGRQDVLVKQILARDAK